MELTKYVQTNLRFNSDTGSDSVDEFAFAKVNVTFWGGRSVHIVGYEGSIYLDTLAKDYFNEVKKCAYEQDHIPFNRENRTAAIRMQQVISHLYKLSDKKLAKTSWFTKLCHWARSFFSSSSWNSKYDYRLKIEQKDAYYHSLAFSKDQFSKAFGVSPCNEQGSTRSDGAVEITVWENRQNILYVPNATYRKEYFD